MPEKRHQVFVSSTYADLLEERSEVMQALLELECMPAGMELFPAANDSQWGWIQKVIDESDYYLVIVAGRYGTISNETGLSYTEMEYRYALEGGIPTIGFIREDLDSIPGKKLENNAKARKKLDEFHGLVKQRLCKFYTSPSDLGAKVSRSITQLRKQHPAIGWIRADAIDHGPEVLALKQENQELKDRLERLGSDRPINAEKLACGEETFAVGYTFLREYLHPDTQRYRKKCDDTGSVDVSWDDLFVAIGTRIVKSPDYWGADSLNDLVARREMDRLDKRFKGERISRISVPHHVRDAIFMQFRALGFIVAAGNNKWELTPYGNRYFTTLTGIFKKSQEG